MKKTSILLLLSIITAFSAKSQDFNKSMVDIMKSMKTYTIEMVELMPEGKFDFKPADSVRTFGGQVKHMISTNHFLLNYYLIGDEKTNREDELQTAFSSADYSKKADLIKALSDEFDNLIAFLENATSDYYQKTYKYGTPENPIMKDYFTTVMLIRDHFSHHRSQLIVYLRINEIEPAQFRPF